MLGMMFTSDPYRIMFVSELTLHWKKEACLSLQLYSTAAKFNFGFLTSTLVS
jgi:hypothetical protein